MKAFISCSWFGIAIQNFEDPQCLGESRYRTAMETLESAWKMSKYCFWDLEMINKDIVKHERRCAEDRVAQGLF